MFVREDGLQDIITFKDSLCLITKIIYLRNAKCSNYNFCATILNITSIYYLLITFYLTSACFTIVVFYCFEAVRVKTSIWIMLHELHFKSVERILFHPSFLEKINIQTFYLVHIVLQLTSHSSSLNDLKKYFSVAGAAVKLSKLLSIFEASN